MHLYCMCQIMVFNAINTIVTDIALHISNYYKHTAFSWGCYGRLPHEGKTITLWKKNITRDEECDIFSRVWSSTISPSTKGSMCFIILNVSSKEYFEFLLESVNQWDTLCTYHYLNKATTTIISTSNIFINNNRKTMSTINI